MSDEEVQKGASSEPAETVPRRRRWPYVLLVLFVLLLAGAIALWSQRGGIAAGFIDREFERRGVRASYEVERLGFRAQRFRNLVIGDPDRPDLTADRVEVDLLLGFHAPRIGMIRASGVRLRGRVVGNRVLFGEVDRLLPPPSGEPFRLPDQEVTIADAGIALETPLGAVGIGLSGSGNLSDGFSGHAAAAADRLVFGACHVEGPRAVLALEVDRRRPRIAGPSRAIEAGCGETLALDRPEFALSAIFSESLTRWEGRSDARIATLRAGPQVLAEATVSATFAGDGARTAGRTWIGAAAAASTDFRAGRTSVEGDYAFYPRRGQQAFVGRVTAEDVAMRDRSLAPLTGALAAARGTPAGPVAAALAQALERAAGGGGLVTAEVRAVNEPAFGAARFERVDFAARSGARIRVDGGIGLTYYWPDRMVRIDTDVALTGGGFPDARFTVSQPRGGGPMRGEGRIAPMAAGDARLAFGRIRLDAAPDGRTRFETVAEMSGPFDGGRIEGLRLPLSGSFGGGGFAIGEACTPVRFRRLDYEGLRLDPAALTLCPEGRALVWRAPGGAVAGGAVARDPRLSGTLGSTPLRIAADRLRFGLDGPAFAADGAVALLGADGAATRLAAAAIGGTIGPRGVSGPYEGLSARIPGVPLLFDEGAGEWRVEGGALRMAGGLAVSDAEEDIRFYPLVSDDFRLTLIDNRIAATAAAREAQSGRDVLDADVTHDLASGVGQARLTVPGLTFTPEFQPDDVTPLTVGVVALVDGTLTGEGLVAWNERETVSTGTFSTEGMNLAAPFGPVEDLTTTVAFTDLLGLVSAPGQVAQVGTIRTGIDVFDGIIRYQLLPDLHVRIEEGVWPFAGGLLRLQETLLDFSRESVKRLTFGVEGLEAASFVQQMEFGNIAATGTFDGTIPLAFDIRGGRIVDGRLEAREGGGTLSYIGEVSQENLGTFGKLAFDALRRLRYSRFLIGLDGSLDGEFLTRLQIDGVNRITDNDNWIVRQFSNLPFRFNVRIAGPLRAIIATTRSFDDPSLLIQPVLPEELRDLPTSVTDLPEQSESEDQP